MSDTQPQTVDSTEEAPDAAKTKSRPRRPVVLTILTALLVLGFGLAFALNSEVEDLTGLGLDVINFMAFFAYLAVSALWILWILFLSRWDYSTRFMAALAVFLIPFTALKVLNPVFGGDMTITGFQPIWTAPPQIPDANAETAAAMADLLPISEFDFPQFLGPDRTGVIRTASEIDWAALNEESIIWKIPVGPAWSGFAAANGFAVTMEQRQDQECVSCYRIADGELIWIYQHKARHIDAGGMGHVGPRSTPLIHGGRVYAVGALGNFVCLDGADGTIVWQVNLNKLLDLELKKTLDGEFPGYGEKDSSLEWGRSGSPMVYEDCVIIPGGGKTGGPIHTLLSFDLETGDLKWKAGDEMIAYGSPSLQTLAGVPQILMMAESKGMSFDPKSGDVLWTWNRPGSSAGMANTSQMFAVDEETVLMSKGYPDGAGTLIRVRPVGEDWQAEELWNSPRVLKTKLTSPVLSDGYAYSISNGFLECARLSDGKRIWKHRGRLGHGQLLLVNDHLVVQSEFGELFVAPATPDGYNEVVSFSTVEGICWNPLCLAGDKLLLRADFEAACLQLPVKSAGESEIAVE